MREGERAAWTCPLESSAVRSVDSKGSAPCAVRFSVLTDGQALKSVAFMTAHLKPRCQKFHLFLNNKSVMNVEDFSLNVIQVST